MTQLTEEQRRIGKIYEERAIAAINDEEEFNAIMAEFEEWKKKEGINL